MASNRRRLILKTVAATLVAAGVVGALAGAAVHWSGWYNIGATVQHRQVVHTVLEKGMHNSVRRHARDIVAPPLDTPRLVRQGAIVYRDKCAQCHGGPGFAQSDYGQSMQPVPGPLMDASTRWQARELYWITRHGIKMSGMPAWEYHLSDHELWAVVAFVTTLPGLTPKAYADITAAHEVAR
jgi:mono/diheme cytochrome c family protein